MSGNTEASVFIGKYGNYIGAKRWFCPFYQYEVNRKAWFNHEKEKKASKGLELYIAPDRMSCGSGRDCVP